MRKFLLVLALALASAMLLAACGDDDDDGVNGNGDGSPTDGADGEGVSITLQEWSVTADPSSTAAGAITFNIENTGPADPHEFVVIQTDLEPGNLPTGEDGAVDEDGEGIEIIDEVEEIEVGAMETLTVNLEAGSYALICNLVEEEDGETESHYALGMYTGFTVE